MADDDDPVDTIVSFTQRDCGNAGEDKDVQLAKLYAHVQSMPDSTKKRKLIKQVSVSSLYFWVSHPRTDGHWYWKANSPYILSLQSLCVMCTDGQPDLYSVMCTDGCHVML